MMTESVLMLLLLSLLPLLITYMGKVYRDKAPKYINWAYGYRSPRSMKNTDTWAFAHETIGKLWLYGGMILELIVAFTIIVIMDFQIKSGDWIVTLFLLLPLVFIFLSIFYIESRLKGTFDETGARKSLK